MIIKEKFIEPASKRELYRLYSNKDFYLRKGDILYEEIIEAQENNEEYYTETSIPIPEKIINDTTFYKQMVGNRQITESVFNKGKEIFDNIIQSLPYDQLYYISFLCPEWKPEKVYNTGDKVFYNNRIYEALDTVSLISPDNTPLFIKIEPPQDIIESWDDSYNKNYKKGDKVRIGNHIYISKIENNIWSPIDFPAAWQLVEGSQD